MCQELNARQNYNIDVGKKSFESVAEFSYLEQP
jgi:hypothetical protein